jgi:uncharacterized membrane protein
MSLSRLPLKLILGLALTVAIDTVVQLAWKIGAVELPELTLSWSLIDFGLHQVTFYIVIGLMLCQLFNWLMVLGEADLSFAQPITALSRITVCLASAYFLGERVAVPQMIGIAMVCAGAWCICQTRRDTVTAAVPGPRS